MADYDWFKKAFDFMMISEGGLSHNNFDRGGLTNYGITLKTFQEARHLGTEDDLKNMSQAEAEKIYYNLYWVPLNFDNIPDTHAFLSVIFFDQAVNRGRSACVKDIQAAAGVKTDGVFGENTLQELISFEPKLFGIKFIRMAQLNYLIIVHKNPSQEVFLAGWMMRVNRLLEYMEAYL